MRFSDAIKVIRSSVEEALRKLSYEEISFNIEEPPSKELGDLYTNVAFLLAKIRKEKPIIIAQNIASNIIKPDFIERIYAHPTGYINFVFNKLSFANNVLKSKHKSIDLGKNERVIIEHTSVNPNKALHMGHVRNLVIGDTLYRLLKFTNHNVIVLNYIDDSGLQVADIIVGFYFLKMPLDTNKKFDQYCGDEIYVKVNKLYEDNQELLEKRREVLRAMEDYNSEIAKFARNITSKVISEQLKTCWRLKARYDCLNFESQIIAAKLWDMIKDILLERNIAKIDNEPNSKYYKCLVIKSEQDEDKVLERSDGTATYIAKDIPYAAWKLGLINDPFSYIEYAKQFDNSILYATILNNDNNITFSNGDKVITIIDVRQARLQRIITNVLNELNNKKPYIHLAYEVVTLSSDTAKQLGIESTKKFVHMKGRSGTYVNADVMLDKLHEKAYIEAKKRNPTLDDNELHAIAEEIAIAAIRYSMLKQDLDKVIIFDISETLRLEGDTGPYIQYSYARAYRILEKKQDYRFEEYKDITDEEFALLKEISKLDLIIEESVNTLAPKLIARYAYRLANLFNTFYEHVQVLNSKEEDARLSLIRLYIDTMNIICLLMGIETLRRM